MSEFAVIVSANINNPEKVDAYKNIAGPIMKKYGATMPPQSFEVVQLIAGKAQPSFMLKIEFPDKQSITQAFNDPDYKAVIQERDEGFGDLSIFAVA